MIPAPRIVADETGAATTGFLSFAPTWFAVFGVFLMNVQLGQSYVARDLVDHAAAVAADDAAKTYCEGGPAAAKGAATADATRLLALVSGASPGGEDACSVAIAASPLADPGAVSLDLDVTCRLVCAVPFASRVMCADGVVKLSARERVVARGCDGS